ncbi:MAG: manganese efflux pump MntP family protein [Clostridia bacterium]|nr:manganese efflux pump MntP family protein [Clostridia bacterium]
MDIVSLLFLSVALAMDAFSVAVTDGLVVRSFKAFDALKVGLFFGLFQFLMPCIGNFLASFASSYIESFDHWIAFGLLAFLGIRMIWEALRGEEEIPQNPLKISTLFLMAIATSIDALAAGISLAAVSAPILFSSLVIGIVAFLFSFFGMYAGRKFGDILGNKAEIIGGIILILIGTKTLLEHIFG